MEAQQLHRGRLIDHVSLIARDLEATKRFYAAVLAVLGRTIEGEGENYFWSDEIFVAPTRWQPPVQRMFTWRFKRRIARPSIASMRPRSQPEARITASRVSARSITPIIRSIRNRSGRQQHRGRVSRAGEKVGGVGGP